MTKGGSLRHLHRVPPANRTSVNSTELYNTMAGFTHGADRSVNDLVRMQILEASGDLGQLRVCVYEIRGPSFHEGSPSERDWLLGFFSGIRHMMSGAGGGDQWRKLRDGLWSTFDCFPGMYRLLCARWSRLGMP